ncbi:MAG TPA: 50S ribosomal protein L21 [Acholeplasmatales bacterium]|nr:50S ribosomal protein L21 [Bacillota bacterium]OHE42352.1 MAG: 50S ribosomal protein L21 [Tenericutes bacterium GWF2_57_13]HAQ56249.1 50S ribosomal protein L21 [Acholeplasmatales bacterium]
MYAVIETGGKQVRVEVGTEIWVEKLEADVESVYTFDKVLLVGGDKIKIGKPYVKGALVKAVVNKQGKGPKVIIFKYEPKKHYHKKNGHRQPYTKLTISEITL